MTISQDRVKPSPVPDSWKLNEIFATGIVIGTYLALIAVLFYWTVVNTDFFEVWVIDIDLSADFYDFLVHIRFSSTFQLGCRLTSR